MSGLERISFPTQSPGEFAPGLVIDILHAKDVSGLEDEAAYVVNPDYQESLWASRIALMRLVNPKNFNGPLRDITMTVLSEPFAHLVHAQSRGSGFKFFNDAGDLTRVRAGIESFDSTSKIIGLTMKAMAYSRGAEFAPVEMDVWYGRQVIGKGQADEAVGVKRIVSAPRYDAKKFSDAHKASKQRGKLVQQGTSGKKGRGGPGIDPHS